MNGTPKHKTWSLCPVCARRVSAGYIQIEKEIFFEQYCSEHGSFSTLFWRGNIDFESWRRQEEAGDDARGICSADRCGLCRRHLSATCCVLYEVTGECNLRCPFCFADGIAKGYPELGKIKDDFLDISSRGDVLLQLSGGEPTIRNDLTEIICAAKAAGILTVQMNTNGIRLAEEPGYAQSLMRAGLSFVFMQFDGLDDAVYVSLRGQPLLDKKVRAIENCGLAGLGVVLVPTLVPGINDDQIGGILRFAAERTPTVRGVHYQPVTYLGRTPTSSKQDGHFTLDSLLAAIERQSGGTVKTSTLSPSNCDHALCGFHGDFLADSSGQLQPIRLNGRQCCARTGAEANRRFVTRRWKRDGFAEHTCGQDTHTFEGFLQRVRKHGFTVTAMAFQDARTLDLQRLRRCSLHVYSNGRMIPFCAYYRGLCQP